MDEPIKKFKACVVEAASNPNFIHHKWFVKWHLELVDKLASELCDIYKSADRDLVELLVWLHDYGKILDFDKEHETTLLKGKQKLLELGFPKPTILKAIKYVELMDKKDKLDKAPIEVKIVSSADGAAHLIGPFFPIHWYENPKTGIEELMQGHISKALSDWNKKIVLPEIKKAFKTRHEFLLETNGKLPKHFL
ncbi:MAG: HD domain-containing protein [archaeon]|jgi:hypothetical protein